MCRAAGLPLTPRTWPPGRYSLSQSRQPTFAASRAGDRGLAENLRYPEERLMPGPGVVDGRCVRPTRLQPLGELQPWARRSAIYDIVDAETRQTVSRHLTRQATVDTWRTKVLRPASQHSTPRRQPQQPHPRRRGHLARITPTMSPWHRVTSAGLILIAVLSAARRPSRSVDRAGS